MKRILATALLALGIIGVLGGPAVAATPDGCASGSHCNSML
jgi:hypothetical protein